MKLRKLIALSSLALGFGTIVSFMPAKRIEVRAEEEQTTQVVEEIEEKNNKFIDEFLVPLVIALAGSNVGGIIAAVIFFIIKHRKELAKNAALSSLMDMLGKYLEKIGKTYEEIEDYKKAFNDFFENSKILIENEHQLLISYKGDFEKIRELKTVMVCMAEAQLAEIKGQAENVKSGLSHEVSEIQEKLKLLK